MNKSAPIVISLGGSLVVPSSGIAVDFLHEFRELILHEVKRGSRFIIIAGGGATARAYMQAASKLAPLLPEDMDWLGIHACRMNGHLLRTIFRTVAHPVMVKDPRRKIAWSKPILIGTGWKPGWSSDYVATRFAHLYGATKIINLTNIERVYDKDPSKFPDAKPFDEISWKDFRKIVGTKWSPGSNAPFDPIASTLAHRWKMEIVIAKGTDLKNVQAILEGKEFQGTIIR